MKKMLTIAIYRQKKWEYDLVKRGGTVDLRCFMITSCSDAYAPHFLKSVMYITAFTLPCPRYQEEQLGVAFLGDIYMVVNFLDYLI